MRNRYSKILCLLLLFVCCLPQDGNAIWPFKKKKKEEKKEVLTPYQKLFKDKKVQTARGLMTVHKVEDKIYVEFPVAMFGRELLLTSSIENTSDGGEGAPGQLGVSLSIQAVIRTLPAHWITRIIRVSSIVLRCWHALRTARLL